MYETSVTSVTANWLPLGSAVGYRLEAYSDSGYTSLIGSSVTLSGVTPSTLTITGLSAHTSYYFRVGGINHNGVVNFATIGVGMTTVGDAPVNPAITAVHLSSITVGWTDVLNNNGYVLEADDNAGFGSVNASSTTFDGQLTALSVQGLNPNTTYYVRAGALYNGATVYSVTTPVSTATLSSVLSGAQVYAIHASSLTLNWLPFTSGSGAGTAIGYRIEASSTGFAPGTVIYSSTTFDVAQSTLHVTGLDVATIYDLRVGALNWNVVPNFIAPSGSPATTGVGSPPGNPTITMAAISSMTVTWADVADNTGYVVQASTWNAFSGTLLSTATVDADALSLSFDTGQLTANTTYYLRAGALYGPATAYALTTPTSTSTLTTFLSGAQFASVGVTYVRAHWLAFAAGSGAGTAEGYWLQASADSAFSSIAGSSRTYDVALSTLQIGGLIPATTYYLRVGALNHHQVPNFVTLAGSTVTLRTPTPTGLAGTAVDVSAINWAWGAVSGASEYRLYLATSPTTMVYSGIANSYLETGLSTNTAYGRVVSAVLSGVESDLSAGVTTYTKAATPGQPAFSNVMFTSFTATWPVNGNPAGTRYEISSSTDSNFSGAVSTPVVFADNFTTNSTDFLSLTPGTTYYVRLRAINGDDQFTTAFSVTGSTVTRGVPVPQNLTATALGVSSMSWTWTAIPQATSYRLYMATSPTTLVTTAASAAVDEVGLSTNTLYSRVVSAVISGVEGAVSASASAYTKAAVPSAPAISGVSYTSFTVTWSAGGNPAGTRFEVSRSTDDFTADISTPIAFASNFTNTTTTFTGLVPNTTYYVRLRAINGDGLFVTAFTATASTQTWNTPAPVGMAGTALGVSSVSWTWSAIPNASEYRVYQATSSLLLQSVASPTWDETGLAINTAYGRRVSAVLNTAEGPLSASATVYTWAATPATPVISLVAYSSFSVAWGASGNPAGTRYEITRSTDNFVTAFSTVVAFSDSFTGNSTDFVSLTPGTSYYVRLRAINGDDQFTTAFSATASTRTLALTAPSGFTGSVLGTSSITWNWGAVPGASTYRLYLATSPTTIVGTTTGLSFDETGLSTNTAYGRGVRSVLNGGESALSTMATYYTHAAIAGAMTFSNVQSNRLTVAWDAQGNPGTTPYELSVSSDSSFAVSVSTPIGFVAGFTANTTNVMNLNASTTYYLRLRARNGDGVVTSFSVVGSTRTLDPTLTTPTGFTGTAMGVSSISWTWDAVTGATSYRIYQATSTATLLQMVASESWSETGLSTNTSYGRVVMAVAGSVTSSLSDAATTYTWASPPSNFAFATNAVSSMSVQWTANGNPPGTTFEADLSLSANFASATTSATLSTTALYTSLSPNATYYARLRALNGDGVATVYSSALSTYTWPAAPVSGSFTSVTDTSVSFAWASGGNASGTRYQAEISSISAVGAASSTVITTALSLTFSGLLPDTTYYARVKALGLIGFDSAYLTVGSTMTSLTPPTSVRFSSATTTTLQMDWQSTTGPDIEFISEVTSGGGFATPVTATTTVTLSSFTGLSVNTQYFGRVRIHNTTSGNFSTWSTVVSTYTWANAPTTLSTTSVANTSVALSWNGNGNPAGTLYGIERSTSGVTWSQVTTTNNTTYTDIGLTAGTVYLYRVRAFNGNLIPTSYAGPISVLTTGSPSSPKRPTGLWGERSEAGGGNVQLRYHWRAVSLYEDGSVISNLAGYQIYSSSSLFTPKSAWTLVTVSPDEEWETTVASDQVTYYSIRAVDGGGAVSEWTEIIDGSADINHYVVGSDYLSRAIVPQSAAHLLRGARNIYGADLRMEWDEVASEETGRVVRSARFKLVNEDSGDDVAIAFDPPLARIVLAYEVLNGQIVTGIPSASRSSRVNDTIGSSAWLSAAGRSPVISATNAATQLSLFWYNGREWVKTNGVVNTADNTVSITGGRTGSFQIRAASRSPGVTMTKVYPKIISPNGDGWNDKAVFEFDNPQLLPLSGKVYDITGAFVADMAFGRVPDSTLVWDGKDSAGSTVPGGIYVYQVDTGNGATTGTVVVAR